MHRTRSWDFPAVLVGQGPRENPPREEFGKAGLLLALLLALGGTVGPSSDHAATLLRKVVPGKFQ